MGLSRRVELEPEGDLEGAGFRLVRVTWLVQGQEGAVQFVAAFFPREWISDETDRWRRLTAPENDLRPPLPLDMGRHSPVPLRADEELFTESCSVLGGMPCYYEGSGALAIDLLLVLRNGFEAVFWESLRGAYGGIFGMQEWRKWADNPP